MPKRKKDSPEIDSRPDMEIYIAMFEPNRRAHMKRIFAATILAVLLVTGAGFLPSEAPLMKASGTARADESASCSLAAAAGNYGFTLTGTLLLPTGAVPGGAVGTLTVDAAGNISGTEARSIGGGLANETLTGRWTVSSDCTSTASFQVY